MDMSQIPMRSPIASVNQEWEFRLYFVATDGGVREIQHGADWTGGRPNNKIGTVKQSSPLAATSLGLKNIRVYGVSDSNTLSEFAYDAGKGWYEGALSGRFKVAPSSCVAAVFLRGETYIRVFAQQPSNIIKEYGYNPDSGWFESVEIGKGLNGTSIAATEWHEGGNRGMRVYFQDESGKIVERCWDEGQGWSTGGLSISGVPPMTPLSVISWNNSSHIRLYYGTSDNHICEKAWDTGKWFDGAFKTKSVQGSRVTALTAGGSNLRVYLQKGDHQTAFSEFSYNNGWKADTSPLPPAK